MQSAKSVDESDDLQFLIRDLPIVPERIRRFLDERSHEARVAAIRSLSGSALHRLYVGVDGFKPVTLEEMTRVYA